MDITEREFALRIADAADMIEAVETDEDGNMQDPSQFAPFMSALDYALRGDPGCNEPAEWEERRREALVKHRRLLGL